MTTTEHLLILLGLAQSGLRGVAAGLPRPARANARAAIKDWHRKAVRARTKLLRTRNAAALRQSMEQMRPQVERLPARCHACAGRLYYDLRPQSAQLDYLHCCLGMDTFDCALQCLRHRATPYAGPLVPPVPKLCLPE